MEWIYRLFLPSYRWYLNSRIINLLQLSLYNPSKHKIHTISVLWKAAKESWGLFPPFQMTCKLLWVTSPTFLLPANFPPRWTAHSVSAGGGGLIPANSQTPPQGAFLAPSPPGWWGNRRKAGILHRESKGYMCKKSRNRNSFTTFHEQDDVPALPSKGWVGTGKTKPSYCASTILATAKTLIYQYYFRMNLPHQTSAPGQLGACLQVLLCWFWLG